MALAAAAAPPKSLKQLFIPPPAEKCTRCDQRVYHVEKIGPVNEVIFHKQCFRCSRCGQHLTLKTYFTNQTDYTDKEIYCNKDCPKVSTHGYDARAVGIRAAMSVPKGPQSNVQIRGTGDAPRIGADAMHIRTPMSAQMCYQRKYSTKYDRHHFPAYLVNKTKEKLYQYQEDLEKQQREEEDRLMEELHAERKQEAEHIEKEFSNEWEVQLKDLMSKFESKADRKGTERYEREMEDLKKTMTLKMLKKKEALSLRLQTTAQQKTSTLVKKHSEQMLELLKSKQEELKKQLEEEIKAQAEASGQSANGASTEEVLEEAMAAIALPTELPDPHPPMLRKRDLYHDPSVFQELDEDVFKVAESEQCSFTELVRQLTEHCLSDLQKVRAIFRWITVKDLNVMEFDETVKQDTPMGLLRGIKYGTETYHTLFMRLCSYAGLACQEIRGHSKSVGYEPGMKIREDTFQNTWNVVLVLGDWWPVQCNWGARHLVLNKDSNHNIDQKKTDKIRYQYDEHYFLTDPDEFIQEFWAKDPQWQLLERSITLEEFEAMPFVRSVFFHFSLEFLEPMKAVLYADTKGGVQVKLGIPDDLTDDLVFHYQLRFSDRDRRNDLEYGGAKIERFVFYTLTEGVALFSVHVPTTGSYFLEIFASKINDSNKIGDDPNTTMMPFRLKCATKFKIVCEDLAGKMHPLPACASGEWGPAKGRRHFGLKPLSHSGGIINVENDVEIRFRLPRSLHFHCKFRNNTMDDQAMERFVSHSTVDGTLTIRLSPPQIGQYGLDVYARPEDASNSHTLAHACKYLINCTRVLNPVDVPPKNVNNNNNNSSNNNNNSNQSRSSSGSMSPGSVGTKSPEVPSPSPPPAVERSTIGPLPAFDEYGLKTISHKDPIIDRIERGGALTIELGVSDGVRLSYMLTRDPEENWQHRVSAREGSRKWKFSIVLPKPGVYKFEVFAAKKDEKESRPVYLYVITYDKGDGESSKRRLSSKN